MKIPGRNLLSMASQLISPQSITYSAFTGRTLQPNGQYTETYAAPVSVQGNVQPVPRQLFERLGLDFQKNYYRVFISQAVEDIDRLTAGDQFTFDGMLLQVESNTRWSDLDGWTECLCVEVPQISTFYITESGFRYITEDASQAYAQE